MDLNRRQALYAMLGGMLAPVLAKYGAPLTVVLPDPLETCQFCGHQGQRGGHQSCPSALAGVQGSQGPQAPGAQGAAITPIELNEMAMHLAEQLTHLPVAERDEALAYVKQDNRVFHSVVLRHLCTLNS